MNKPNVILILADDVGYEIPTANGGRSYSTPNIDQLAQQGMNFTHCEASPLCAPSRLMLLTGKYSFRNYSIWGYVNKNEKTLGNLMHDAGYKTGWFGKLQTYSSDRDIHNMGFDNYLIWCQYDLLIGSHYKDPVIYGPGEVMLPSAITQNKYGEDIFRQGLFDFIDSNKHNPFFAYYPINLCHTPFSPTPDDPQFASWDPLLNVSDTAYFPSMVKYMDKEVGEVIAKLRSDSLDQNTIIIFTGDNGTPKFITSIFDGDDYQGEKGSTTEAGTHVPLMVYWPGHIAQGAVNDDLVDFTDLFPTLADMTGTKNLDTYGVIDGKSFYPRLMGQPGAPRNWIFDHFTARPEFGETPRRWVQNKTYKLYDTTKEANSLQFYNIVTDRDEAKPIPDSAMTHDEKVIKKYLRSILDTMPYPPAAPILNNIFVTDITERSATVGATIVSSAGSPLIERGSLINHEPDAAYYNNNRLVDPQTGMGTFQQVRDGLLPQTGYRYSLYAMNESNANNTGFIKDSFYTLSDPPLARPSSFVAKPGNSSIILSWAPAQFPSSGATQAGYLLVYSTQMPSLIYHPNQHAPAEVISNGTQVMVNTSVLPATPALTTTVVNLQKDSIYHFLLVPYTWNGTNEQTYNYLTEGALTATCTPAYADTVLQVNVFPNPTGTGFHVIFTNDEINDPASIKVFDVDGKILLSVAGAPTQTYSLGSNLAPGIYFIQVKQGALSQTFKVVKM